jgi:beta-barrel assembly-enhancing protease
MPTHGTQAHPLAEALRRNALSRRQALWLFGASTVGLTVTSLQGCAQSPVSGERILVGMSEQQERQIDAQVAPHQFSSDMGAVQDAETNRYVVELGQRLHPLTHRPTMPYSYRVVNANHINAYTFPGGAMGVTRGIVVAMEDEAELAALLGHEMGHVNARHAAQRQGQALLAQAAAVGLDVAMSDSQWRPLIGIGSQIGASAMLARYSRDHEREADALGQEYLVRGGYPASGMTQLHQRLLDRDKAAPSLLATMFSSHPMSSERVANADTLAQTRYRESLNRPTQRERYMDRTAGLRRLRPTIEACQRGETAMAKKAFADAQTQFAQALKATPSDYPANLRMAQCLQALGKNTEARHYALAAQNAYPEEAQAHKLAGVLSLSLKQPDEAYAALTRYSQRLPGDPGVEFLQGVAQEALGNQPLAAAHFQRFVAAVGQGDGAQYATSRLKAWGYLR